MHELIMVCKQRPLAMGHCPLVTRLHTIVFARDA